MNDIVYAAAASAAHGSQSRVHENWEFVYCLSGSGEYVSGAQKFSFAKGDLVAVPPHTAHFCAMDKGCKIVQVHMDQPTIWLEEPCLTHGDGSAHLQAVFEAALYYFRSSIPAKTQLLTAYGSLIICYLFAYHTGQAPSPTAVEIEAQIRSRFTDPSFELDTYLHSLPFNYDYLRKLFQREMGVTPLQYLNNLRLQTAAEALLKAEGISGSVTDIARMCGFREPLYFSRMFKKKYGLSPAHYAASAAGQKGLTPASEEA